MAEKEPIKGYHKKEGYIKKANEVEIKYNIPHNMLVGLMATESNYNPNAKSSVGAQGLMQFMPATAKQFNIDPYNTDQAIDAAGRYLSQNYKQLGNWDDTLRSYNMGLGNVNKWKAGKMKLPKETAEYTGKVYKNMGVAYDDTFSNKVAPYINQEQTNTTPLTNFDISIDKSNFVSVPELKKEEETPSKQEEKSESLEKLKEDSFLKDYKSLYAQQEQQQQEQPINPIQSTNLEDIYNQVSNFIDTPFNII